MTTSNRPHADRLTRFVLQRAGVRGVCVNLGAAWREIRGHADYPATIERWLGEAVAAAALFTGNAKVDGRLSVQLRSNGPLRTLFAECTAAGTLRGIAQVDGDAARLPGLAGLGPGAMLAITIENPAIGGRDPVRYQGLVALEADDLSAAFEDYFRRSEQLPTRLLLAAGPDHAAGLMLQRLPGDVGDDDGWTRINALFETLGADELVRVDPGTLLLRLFHDEAPQLVGERDLRFGCSCSRGRVADMLRSLGEAEALAASAATAGGDAEIRCEFCGREYRFSPGELRELFRPPGVQIDAPQRLQ